MNWAPTPKPYIQRSTSFLRVLLVSGKTRVMPPRLASSPSQTPNLNRLLAGAVDDDDDGGRRTDCRSPAQLPSTAPAPAPDAALFLFPRPAMSSQVQRAPNLRINSLFFSFFFIIYDLVRRRSVDFDRSVEFLWGKVELKRALLVSWLGDFGNWMFGFVCCSFEFFACMKFALNAATFFYLVGWKQCE